MRASGGSAAERMAATAGQRLCALGQCVGHKLLNLRQTIERNQRALFDAWLEGRTNLQGARGPSKFLAEGIVNARLDIKAVGTHAGLSAVAEF
jgi:hypothetical protein